MPQLVESCGMFIFVSGLSQSLFITFECVFKAFERMFKGFELKFKSFEHNFLLKFITFSIGDKRFYY